MTRAVTVHLINTFGEEKAINWSAREGDGAPTFFRGYAFGSAFPQRVFTLSEPPPPVATYQLHHVGFDPDDGSEHWIYEPIVNAAV